MYVFEVWDERLNLLSLMFCIQVLFSVEKQQKKITLLQKVVSVFGCVGLVLGVWAKRVFVGCEITYVLMLCLGVSVHCLPKY